MSGDRAEARDAHVRAWQRWSSIARYDVPEAWLRTVGHRLCVNRWRKTRNSPS